MILRQSNVAIWWAAASLAATMGLLSTPSLSTASPLPAVCAYVPPHQRIAPPLSSSVASASGQLRFASYPRTAAFGATPFGSSGGDRPSLRPRSFPRVGASVAGVDDSAPSVSDGGEGDDEAEKMALFAELAEIDSQRAELKGGASAGGRDVGNGGGGGEDDGEAAMRRTAEHLNRLERMVDPAKAGADDPHATERQRLFEEMRMRPANDLKEELRGLKLKATGRKPDLARRLADHYTSERRRDESSATPEERAAEGKVETVPAQQVQPSADLDLDSDDAVVVPLTKFASLLELSTSAGTALSRANFKQSSPIQAQACTSIARGESCILHAETGSGKTLAYLLPVTELLWKEHEAGLNHGVDDGVGYGIILTPTRELAAQVAGVATVLAPPGSVRLIGQPSNLLRDGKSERGEMKYGGRRTDDDEGGRMSPRLLVGSAKAIVTSLFGNDKMPAPPTSKPEAKMLLGNVRWLVMDEVDRLLNVKKARSERAYKRHEKPAAVIASAVARHTLGKAQVVAASATVGRPLRRELSRVLGLSPQECPPIIRGSSDGDADANAGGAPASRFSDITRTGSGGGVHVGRAVTIPPTVQNYVLPCLGDSSGSLLTTAASIIKELPPPRHGQRGRRTLLVLSKGCELNVKNALGALKHFECKPAPRSLIDMLEADGTDKLIQVHRAVSGATGVGQSSDATSADEGYLLVTGEDSVRGLHLDNLDTVLVVGRPFGPDEYTHIAGRTGRAGREGKVINIVSYEQAQALTSWEKMLGIDFMPLDKSEVSDLK